MAAFVFDYSVPDLKRVNENAVTSLAGTTGHVRMFFFPAGRLDTFEV